MITDYLVILSIIFSMSLIVYYFTNRSFGALMATISMVMTLAIWAGQLSQVFYVIVAILLGMGLWYGLRGEEL